MGTTPMNASTFENITNNASPPPSPVRREEAYAKLLAEKHKQYQELQLRKQELECMKKLIERKDNEINSVKQENNILRQEISKAKKAIQRKQDEEAIFAQEMKRLEEENEMLRQQDPPVR